jgi:hypothetical protein
MCRLVSVGKERAGKGACFLEWSDVEQWADGLVGLLLPDRADAVTEAAFAQVARIPGRTPQQELERLTWTKAPERYPDGLDARVRGQLEHELKLIADLGYAPYFLTVHSIVEFARSRGILCQGRGSAANSAVCYCLGITSIDPVRSELLFERFVSAERRTLTKPGLADHEPGATGIAGECGELWIKRASHDLVTSN